jgi:hypothetical protein
MLLFYILEQRSHRHVLAFAGACALASTWGFLAERLAVRVGRGDLAAVAVRR